MGEAAPTLDAIEDAIDSFHLEDAERWHREREDAHLDPPQAARWLYLGARLASERGRLAEARQLHAQASHLARVNDDRSTLARVLACQQPAALEEAREAAEASRDRRAVALVDLWTSFAALRAQRTQEAAARAEAAHHHADGVAPGLCCRAAHVCAVVAARRRDRIEELRWLRRAVDLATGLRSPLLAEMLVRMGELALLEGERDRAEAILAMVEALPVSPPADAVRSDLLRWLDRPDDAQRAFARACADPGLASHRNTSLRRAFLAWASGDLASAVRHAADLALPGPWATLIRAAIAPPGELRSVADIEAAVASLGDDLDVRRVLRGVRDRQASAPGAVRRRLALAASDVEGARRVNTAEVPVGPFDCGPLLGAGGHARVYAATHHRSGLPAALKVIDGRADPASLAREAELLARLWHPHVVAVYGMGTVTREMATLAHDGWVTGAGWMAMQRVDGGTLAPVCGALDWPRARRVLLALLDGLGHAHARGVLHLDLKAQNVLIDRGPDGWVPKLADFGVASLLMENEQQVAGSPISMAPEQWSGAREAWGPWTDLYGLGCLAWTLLTGRPMFTAGSVAAWRAAHRFAARPHLEVAAIDDWLQSLFAPDPGDRFRSAAEAAGALPPEEVEHGTGTPRLDDTITFSMSLSTTPVAADAPPVQVPAGPYALGPWRTPHALPPLLTPPSLCAQRLDHGPLFGLTDVQDTLWDHLRAALDREGPTTLRVEGPQRRTLTSWMVTRCRELGVVAARTDAAHPDEAIRALAEGALGARIGIHAGWQGADGPRAWLARGGLTVAVVHGGASATGWVRWLMDHVKVLVTDVPDVDGGVTLAAGRLADAHVTDTVVARVPLSPVLAAQVGRVAAGDLDVALELVRDTVEEGLLVPSGAGWELPSGTPLRRRLRSAPTAHVTTLASETPQLARWAVACSCAGGQLSGPLSQALAERVGLSAPAARARLAAEGLCDGQDRLIESADIALRRWARDSGTLILAARDAAGVSDDLRVRVELALAEGRSDDAVRGLLELIRGLRSDEVERVLREELTLGIGSTLSPDAIVVLWASAAVQFGRLAVAAALLRTVPPGPTLIGRLVSRVGYQIAWLSHDVAGIRGAVDRARADGEVDEIIGVREAIALSMEGRLEDAAAMVHSLEGTPGAATWALLIGLDLALALEGPEVVVQRALAALNDPNLDGPTRGQLEVLVGQGLVLQRDLDGAQSWRERGSLLDQQRAVLDLLISVARGQVNEVVHRVSGPTRAMIEPDGWVPAVDLWLAADADDTTWTTTCQGVAFWRDPGGLGRWVLQEARRRAGDRTERVARIDALVQRRGPGGVA